MPNTHNYRALHEAVLAADLGAAVLTGAPCHVRSWPPSAPWPADTTEARRETRTMWRPPLARAAPAGTPQHGLAVTVPGAAAHRHSQPRVHGTLQGQDLHQSQARNGSTSTRIRSAGRGVRASRSRSGW